MSEAFDLTTVIFLLLAVFVFFRLRSVLGQRTGHEAPPAYRKSAPPEGQSLPPPSRQPEQPPIDPMPNPGRWQDIAPEGGPLAGGLNAVANADRSFDPATFSNGAKAAYEMIVNAFNAGDRKALKPLLSPEVLGNFTDSISEREARGETVQSNFVSIDKAQIVSAALKGTEAQIGVKFESKLISATRNKEGHIVEGDPDRITDVTDLWTFARDTRTNDPNWRLIATEDA